MSAAGGKKRETREEFNRRKDDEAEARRIAKWAAAKGMTVEEYVAQYEALVMSS